MAYLFVVNRFTLLGVSDTKREVIMSWQRHKFFLIFQSFHLLTVGGGLNSYEKLKCY